VTFYYFIFQSTVHCKAGLKWMAMSYDDIRNYCLKVIRVIIFYTENGRSFAKAGPEREKQENNTALRSDSQKLFAARNFSDKNSGKMHKVVHLHTTTCLPISFVRVDKQLVHHTISSSSKQVLSFTIIHNSLSLPK
jgi:hypothetical protein